MLFTTISEFEREELKVFLNTVMTETDYLLFTPDEITKLTQNKDFLTNFIENEKILAAKIEGKIVGIVQLKMFSTFKTKHIGEVAISVLKEYWHKGISKELLRNIEEKATNLSLQKLILYVRSDNDRALSFYKKNGYKVAGQIEQYYHVGENYYACTILEKGIAEAL